MNDPRIIVALDFPDLTQARELAARLDPGHCRVKVGNELFTSAGPELVEWLVHRGFEVFLDLKFHDIPTTVARACAAASALGAWMITVHAGGGRTMLQAARDALNKCTSPPLLVAVTILTSLTGEELRETGVSDDVRAQVLRLARLAIGSGADGLVCSPREAGELSREMNTKAILVTPGIRPAGTESNDQRRAATPAEAIRAGSRYLVVGRPITRAEDPLGALQAIETEVSAALKGLPGGIG